jgi:hypothetical protein
VRAIWVAGYLYAHGGGALSPIALVPDQSGIPGRFLRPYGRDFFAVLTRGG